MAKHFQCTACGKCCYGQLPLTWKDAFANVGRFPLCFAWTPVQKGSKDFALASKIGATVTLPNRLEIAILIMPLAYIPSSYPCPALGENNLCKIHDNKPSRCKAMPFYPYREEKFQAELLVPKKDWGCDTSSNAPIIFQEGKIMSRKDFDQEREELLEQVPLLKRYTEYMQKYSYSFVGSLRGKIKGSVVTSLSSFLTATKSPHAKEIAQQQLPILHEYAAKTAEDIKWSDFHKNYVIWAKEMSYLAR